MNAVALTLLVTLTAPPVPPESVEAETTEEGAGETVPDPAEQESEPESEPKPMQPAGTYEVDELDFDPLGTRPAGYNKIGRTLRVTGTVINGVGVGLLLTSGLLMLMRQRAQGDLTEVKDDPDPARRADPIAKIKRRENMAMGFGIAAGITLVVGTIVWGVGVRQGRRAKRRTAALPMPTAGRDGVGLTWGARF
jgi:hypothetical protein